MDLNELAVLFRLFDNRMFHVKQGAIKPGELDGHNYDHR